MSDGVIGNTLDRVIVSGEFESVLKNTFKKYINTNDRL